MLGFSHLKEIYETCEDPVNKDKSPWTKYMLQEIFLFKRIQLCIPICSMKDNILQKKHGGGLVGYFGQHKTYA